MNASYRLRTICSKGLLLVLLNLLGGVCWNLELEGRRPGGVKFMPAGLDLSHAGSAPVRHHPQPFSTYRFLTHQPEFRPPGTAPPKDSLSDNLDPTLPAFLHFRLVRNAKEFMSPGGGVALTQ